MMNLITARSLAVTVGVSTEQSVAALTFDDGPHPVFTPNILDVLARHAAHATFFMLGEAATAHPALVKRVADAGHAIGNHSWDHPSFPELTANQRRWQLRASAQSLRPYGLKLFRPPYGDQNTRSAFEAKWLGYEVVMWSLDGQDWFCREPRHIADRLCKNVSPGTIFLLHDDQAHTDRALDLFLDGCRGFRFVTLPELFQYGPRAKRAWRQRAEWRRQRSYLEGLCSLCAQRYHRQLY